MECAMHCTNSKSDTILEKNTWSCFDCFCCCCCSNQLQLTLIKSDRYLKEEELELVRVRVRGAISLSNTLYDYGLTARLSVRHLFILSAQRQIPQPSHPEGQVSRGTRLRLQGYLYLSEEFAHW